MVNTSQEKQGYKYTEEFGYIPEDWDIKAMECLGNFYKGSGISKDDIKDSGIPCIRYAEIYTMYDFVVKKCYSHIEQKLAATSVQIKYGDILLAGSGETKEEIGKCVACLVDKAYAGGDNIIFRPNNDDINSIFASYVLNTICRNQLNKLGQGDAIVHIQSNNLKTVLMPVPPLLEQEKIAEVLGDIDSLIDKTQQLINKKKDIKTATMQKLLTPRDDWKEYVIGDLGSTYSGLSGKKKDDFGTGESKYITFLNIMNNVVIDTKQFENVIIQNNENQNRCMKNDLFFNTSSETPEEVGMCATLQDDISNLYLNSFCFGYRLKKPNIVNPRFFAYIFRTHYGRTIMQTLAQGSTRYNLAKDKFMEYKILLPEYLEQNKTTLVLSDMDGEIEALEKELNKYRDLKTGVMQQLLTGKIRLIGKSVEQDDKVVSIEDVAAHKVANDEFKDAILISVLAYKFGNEQYPLGAFRRQKLSYFYKRHANMNIDEYTKKAMGPYNSKMKYQGAENIAIRNKYVKKVGNRGIVATNLISKAEEYYNRYYNSADMQWLDANFHYENNNNLEVLATVDYAINDLVSQNKAITLANIKTYIASDEEWRPKLELDYFTDNAIIKAMEKIKKLFNSY